MAKRYGRNQKNRHKEEITRLKEAYVMVDGLLKHNSNKLREAKETIVNMIKTIESVCEYSIAIPPKQLKQLKQSEGNRPYNRYQMAIHPKPDFSRIMADDCCPPNDSLRTVDLYALQVYLEENIEKLQTAVHIDYSAGKHSTYMISDSGLKSMPHEQLTNELIHHIGKALAKHIQNQA